MNDENKELRIARDFVENTGISVFVTGKAGTGKTTFLKSLKEHSSKRMIVVAPTGVAAINAGGMTIHSFFQLPLSPYVPSASVKSKYDFSQEKRKIISTLDLLVIDEISMVRSDLLDAIDNVLRRFRRHNLPFGGVQLLMIGDLQQLAPVVTEQESSLLSKYYETPFFFGSKALALINYVTIELKHVYRQSDDHFIQLLNSIRGGNATDAVFGELNSRYQPDYKPQPGDGYIRLTTHNATAQKYNETELSDLKSPIYTFDAEIEGTFPEYSYPTDASLQLKVGAQVMFVKNDSSASHRFYNGKIGRIVSFGDDEIVVRCPGDREDIEVTRMSWENAKYVLNEQTKEIESEVQGMFTQFPLRLAWAITIHKSQGLTFERAIIDAGMSFASGQVYVALSRCKSLEGMVLSSPLSRRSIIHDQRVNLYISHQEEQAKRSIALLPQLKEEYYVRLLIELFDFSVLKAKEEGMCRVLDENFYNTFPALVSMHRLTLKSLSNDVISVSEKWHGVIRSKTIEQLNGHSFSERIVNSASFFLKALEKLYHELLDSSVVEVDNKFLKTRYDNTFEELLLEYYSKTGVLKSIIEVGFSVTNYLNFKEKAIIHAIEDLIPKHKKRSKRTDKNVDVKYPELYELLSKWRKKKSFYLDISPSTILRQSVLINIVNSLPTKASVLSSIEGVGRKTVEKYGNEILNIITSFVKDNNLAYINKKEEKRQGFSETYYQEFIFKLFSSGKSIQEIAIESGRSENIVFNELSSYVLAHKIPLTSIVSKEQLKSITDAVLILPAGCSLNEVRKHCLTGITDDQIKLVMRVMKCI